MRSLLLTALVLLSAVGVVSLVSGGTGFLQAWTRAAAFREAERASEKVREQSEKYRLEASVKAYRCESENLRRRFRALPKDPVGVVLKRTFTGPFPIQPTAWVRAQPSLRLMVRADSADNLEIGEPGRPFYRERLAPYRRAFGGEAVEFVPVRVVRQGAFESIQVFGIRDTLAHVLFTLTLNHETRRVIQRNVVVEGEGVSFHSVSPSNRYFVLDYGCCPGVRGFEIFDAMGASRLRGSYHGRLEWRDDTLSYWKVEKDPDPGEGCPGHLDSRVKVRKTAFRSNREAPSDSVRILCLDPGG